MILRPLRYGGSIAYGVMVRSSVSPHASQAHTSTRAPMWPNVGCGLFDFLRSARLPQALHGSPGALPFSNPSNSATRRSSASILEGAARIDFHSSHRSSAASKSERMVNGGSC